VGANDGASWQHAPQLEKLPDGRFVGRQRAGFDTHLGAREQRAGSHNDAHRTAAGLRIHRRCMITKAM